MNSGYEIFGFGFYTYTTIKSGRNGPANIPAVVEARYDYV
jgi:hypothetical protein